ncbi:MAG: membrane protein [Clostridiaceae bacterium BRH_c20a]|nr:MAG: membrane protein [Clostridiaceae bacterium BRH_c20a]
MTSTFVLTLIVLCASILQAGTGFGFAMMAIPFLLLILSPHDAIQLNIILCLLITIIMTYKIRNEVNKENLIRLIKGSLIGVLPGFLIFVFLDVQPLKIFVSILILTSTALLIAKVKIKESNAKGLLTGILSGLLTTSIGMPGPPLLIYFAGAKIDKAVLRSTTMAYFVFICSVSLLLQLSMYNIAKNIWLSTLWSIPFMLIGIYLGERLYTRLDQQLFYKVIYWVLLLTGIYLLITTIVG